MYVCMPVCIYLYIGYPSSCSCHFLLDVIDNGHNDIFFTSRGTKAASESFLTQKYLSLNIWGTGGKNHTSLLPALPEWSEYYCNCVLLGHWVSLMSSLFQQHIKVHVKFIKPPQTGQLHTGLTGRPTVQVTVINNDTTLRLPIRQRGGYQNLHVWDEHVVTEMANDSLLIKSTTS